METQAVADALSLLANIVMAWNTAQIQQALDHWAQRRGGSVPPELIGHIAPTRTEGINLRGIFRFPVKRYVDKILPSNEGSPLTTNAGHSDTERIQFHIGYFDECATHP